MPQYLSKLMLMVRLVFVLPIILSLFFIKCSEPEPKAQAIPVSFYHIEEAFADTSVLKGPVKTIAYYNQTKLNTPCENVEGQMVYLKSTTTYTSDKKKLHSDYYGYDSYKYNAHYYYNKEGLLYLFKTNNEYNRFWYNEEKNPTIYLKYDITLKRKPIFDRYSKKTYTYSKLQTEVTSLIIGYDTLTFEKTEGDDAVFDRYGMPINMNGDDYEHRLYQGTFLPIRRGNTAIIRDKTGQIISEHDPIADRRIDYYYSENHLSKRTEKTLIGQNAYLKETTIYNEQGNPLIEMIEDEPGLYKIESEYKYDKYGNWTQKMTYQILDNNKERKLSGLEVRIITYYDKDEIVTGIDESLIYVNADIQYMFDNITKWNKEKQHKIDEHYLAVAKGDYDVTITLKSALNVESFTPRQWHIVGQAEGDLNGDSIPEKAIIYNTPVKKALEDGESRCLAIYKKKGDEWKLWTQTFVPILPDNSEGLMKNAHCNINIGDKSLIINHWGKDNREWGCTHQYRYIKNRWHLVKYKISEGDEINGHSYLHDLITGDIEVNKYTNGELKSNIYWEKPNRLPLMSETDFKVMGLYLYGEKIPD